MALLVLAIDDNMAKLSPEIVHSERVCSLALIVGKFAWRTMNFQPAPPIADAPPTHSLFSAPYPNQKGSTVCYQENIWMNSIPTAISLAGDGQPVWYEYYFLKVSGNVRQPHSRLDSVVEARSHEWILIRDLGLAGCSLPKQPVEKMRRT